MNDFERHDGQARTVEVIDADGTKLLGETEAERRLRTLSHILYGLYALSLFTGGISALVGVIIDYVKRGDARGTLYASHATWRIRTFWLGALLSLVAWPFLLIYIGYFFFALIWIWGLYRVIRGWLSLLDRRPMYPAMAYR